MPLLQVKQARDVKTGEHLVFSNSGSLVEYRRVTEVTDRSMEGRSSMLIELESPKGTVELLPEELVVFLGAWG